MQVEPMTAKLRCAGALLALLSVLIAVPALTASPVTHTATSHTAITHASAAPAPVTARLTAARAVATSTLGDRVLNKAETKAWHWYAYGAAGPSYFDCSGLAYWAARQLGFWIPRTTYGMLAGSAHLYRIPVSSIRRGDLVFYSSGHVEFDTIWYHTSFGAHHSGTRVSWARWSSWYHPVMAMRFR
jgi:peptidoglycan DL-endopeptidase CwlO